jgi:hypothetical protein
MDLKKRNYSRYVLLFLLFCLTLQTGKSQSISAKATVDSSSIQIGDQVNLRIEIDQPANAKFQIPVFTDTITGKIEIVESFPADTLKNDKLLKITHKYLITCFDSGNYVIPSIAIPYALGDAKDTVRTLPVSLAVTNLPVDTVTQVIDIKPPINTPINFAEAWPYIAGFIILCGLLLLIWLLITRKKKTFFFSTPKIKEAPHVIALRELDNLRSQKLWQNNKVKPYYSALTEIIRTYIEKRFEVQALEMTTDEIIESFKALHFIDPESKDLFKKLFKLADLVKFAKAEPMPDENEISLLNAYQFVNNTKITESTESEQSENKDNNNGSETKNENQVQNQ